MVCRSQNHQQPQRQRRLRPSAATPTSKTAAFATPVSLSLSRSSSSALLCRRTFAPVSLSFSAAAAPRRASVVVCAAGTGGAESESAADTPTPEQNAPPSPQSQQPQGTTSASEILKTLREDSAADIAEQELLGDDRAERSMLGVYRDVDGKSNVWAVEPQEETDTRPQLSKTVIILVAAGFIIAALLILPILPFTNPDQA